MTAEQIARASCEDVFAAVSKHAGADYLAGAEEEFSVGVAEGITMAAAGEPLTIDMFADGSWRSLGKVAGYDAFFTETDQREETAA